MAEALKSLSLYLYMYIYNIYIYRLYICVSDLKTGTGKVALPARSLHDMAKVETLTERGRVAVGVFGKLKLLTDLPMK